MPGIHFSKSWNFFSLDFFFSFYNWQGISSDRRQATRQPECVLLLSRPWIHPPSRCSNGSSYFSLLWCHILSEICEGRPKARHEQITVTHPNAAESDPDKVKTASLVAETKYCFCSPAYRFDCLSSLSLLHRPHHIWAALPRTFRFTAAALSFPGSAREAVKRANVRIRAKKNLEN